MIQEPLYVHLIQIPRQQVGHHIKVHIRPGQLPLKMIFSKSFVFIVKITKSYRSCAIFMKNYQVILEFLFKFDF